MSDQRPPHLRIYHGDDSLGAISRWNARAAQITGCALLFAVATGALIVVLALILYRFNPWLGALALLTGSGLVVAPLLMRQSLATYARLAANMARGAQGEDALAALLHRLPLLDDRYALFRNVVLPGNAADIDAVLVGPRGVFVLEVKRWRGRYLYDDNGWFEWRDGAWLEAAKHPGKQAYANALRVRDYLAARDLRVGVAPRLVWCGPGYLELRQPRTPVWLIGARDARARDYVARDIDSSDQRLAPTTCRQIEQALGALLRRVAPPGAVPPGG